MSMEFKGTPGKWEVHYRTPNKNNFNCCNHEIHVGGNHLADIWSSDHHPVVSFQEGMANALAMSKASEMLKMLKIAHTTIQSLKLSILAHPDCEAGSEFDDYTTMAEETEDKIEQLLKEATEI